MAQIPAAVSDVASTMEIASRTALARLAGVLLSADAHLITLKDSFVGFVMPSKIYACLESGRPLLFVGSSDSDVDLLARSQQGLSYFRVACGGAASFAEALEALASLQRR